MASETQISGLKELDAALKEFSTKVEVSMMRAALRAGVNVFLRRARDRLTANGSVRSRKLYRSLRVSTKKDRNGDLIAILTAGNAEAFYAKMVEFGTDPHLIRATTRSGKNIAARVNRARSRNADALAFGNLIVEEVRHPGAKPHPYMRPALDGGEREAIEVMADYLRKRIAKERMRK